MNKKLMMATILVGGMLLTSVARSEPPTKVQVEVSFLLGYIEGSGCEFFRNGSWHDSQVAQTHLRDKYNYLAARNQILATEDFIDKAATESSFSGRPYEVKCNGGASVKSGPWLKDVLTRLRKVQ